MVEQFSVVQGLGGRDFFFPAAIADTRWVVRNRFICFPPAHPGVGFFQDPTWVERPFQGFATTPPWAGKRQC